MKKIPFPGDRNKLDRTGCIDFGETLQLHFTDAGYFFHDNKKAFSPDLPTCYLEANSFILSGPAANKKQTIVLSFVDASDKQLHRYELTVLKGCPPDLVKRRKPSSKAAPRDV